MKELTTCPYKYSEICSMILARIATGELSPGSRLPSARALGEEYGCNYHTVRRASPHPADQAADRGKPADAPTESGESSTIRRIPAAEVL